MRFLKAIPLKLTLFLVVTASLVGEWFPLSNFPMFSTWDSETYLVYFTDKDDNPIPIQKLTHFKAGRYRKLFEGELKNIKSENREANASALPADLKPDVIADFGPDEFREAGIRVLDWIDSGAVHPDLVAQLDPLRPLKIVRRDIIVDDGKLTHKDTVVATDEDPAHPTMNIPFRDKFKGAFRPVEYAGWEIVFMRAAFALAIGYAFLKIQTFPSAKYEIGVAGFVDLSIFHDPTYRTIFRWIVSLCMLSYAVGFLPSVALPIAAALFIGAGTLNASQATAPPHVLQTGAAVLAVLALWHIIAAIIRFSKPHRLTKLRTYQLAIFFALQTIAAGYITSAVTKLHRSGLSWFTDTKYAPAYIRKTEDSAYFSTLEVRNPSAINETGDDESDDQIPTSQFADAIPRAVQSFLLDHPTAGAFVLGPGLILELFAFLALIGRRWAFLIGLTFIIFHFLVGQIMNLHFELNNHLIIIFFLNIPYWLAKSWRRLSPP